MRRQEDDQLTGWAHQIGTRLRQEGWPPAYLIYHGAPGAGGTSSAHAENTQNLHILEMELVEVDDLNCLREFLLAEGVAEVTVKHANAGGSHNTSSLVSSQETPRS